MVDTIEARDSEHYPWKTTPFRHQLEEWERSREEPTRAIYWEQGTGKSKLTIDTAAWLYMRGLASGLLVLAPEGVHRNWVTDEVPAHMPDVVPTTCLAWYSSRAKTRKQQAAAEALLECGGLAVLTMSYDGFCTTRGKALAKAFLTRRRCLYVLDEARRIKTPRTIRTRTVLASARYAPYRRLLDGTPVANGPFDVYSPLKFLEEKFWHRHGLGTFGAMKAYFGVWEDGWAGGRRFPRLVSYTRLDQLHKIVDRVATRITKDQAGLDLPPKLYSRVSFELTPAQRRLYDELREGFVAELDSGAEVMAPLAIVRLLRLQQITCGYVPATTAEIPPTDAGVAHLQPELMTFRAKLEDIPGGNPRLDTLLGIVEDLPHQAIIWARFRRDIDLICAALTAAKRSWVRYDGTVKDKERGDAVRSFQQGDAEFFVGNPAAAGEGLTLHAARTVIYYNNSFKLTERLQSEDRAHRIGQVHPVHYVDLVAPDTVDERIVAALQAKMDVAAQVTGDSLREWLR